MDDNAAQFVGSIPDFYDRGLGPVLFADYAADTAARVAAFGPRRVLETAAGTGIATRALRHRLPAGATLTATDLNEPMLEIARRKFQPADAVDIRPADAQALPFADASFDAVVCQYGIMFFPDRPLAYREALRVLTPGSRYVFAVWDSHRYNGFARITDALIKEMFPDNPPGFYRVPFSCAEIDPIKRELAEAGFAEIDIAILPAQRSVADLGLFARGLVFGNPLIDQVRARGQVTPEAMHARLVERLEREFGTNPTVVPLQTITYSARKPA